MTLATRNCRAAWLHMNEISDEQPVRNFVQVLDMSDYVVETELFPEAALKTYSALNMEKDISDEQKQYISELRGGAQGNYSEGMGRKIANVVDCLTHYPQSKRAVITMSNQPAPDHRNDADAKCLRELQLYLDDGGQLSATAFFRAQAASIFPKNIHFIGSIMAEVADRLPQKPALGTVFYLATILVSDRA
jgi:thymidylate synthase